jgi:signal peptidase II
MRKNKLFWLVAFLGLTIDQVSKFFIINYLIQGTLPLLPNVFHLTYATNTGAAWSVFQGGVNWLKWLSLLVSLFLIYFALYGPTQKRFEQIGYGFILAGSLGNGIDRFVWGHVVDFLDLRLIHFPIFNVADISINIGIFALLLGLFFDSSQKKRSNN